MDYQPPVDRLLSYGSCLDMPEWPNYLALGLRAEHVPELIRMALDEGLHESDTGSLAVWAPVHAMRALGQLRATAAIEPLIALFRRVDEEDDEWVGEQLPVVYGMLGEAAIPALSAYLDDSANGLWAMAAASQGLQEIAERHPETRAAVVVALSRRLERFVENNVSLNGWLVFNLVGLKAVESAKLIEQAFAFDRVDTMVMGDWEDVQVELGLKAGRTTPRKDLEWDQLLTETAPKPAGRAAPVTKDKQKAKAKRKQVKQSRKKNRKR